MKNVDLMNILNDAEMSVEDKAKKIQVLSGVDRQTEIDKATSKESELTAKIEELTKKYTELETTSKKYANYDDLKKFYDDAVIAKENTRKTEYLKSIGCKYPDLFMDKVDFANAKYNEESKTYEGINVDPLKETYKEMFEQDKQTVVVPTSRGSSLDQMSGVEKAFYANNPNLLKK